MKNKVLVVGSDGQLGSAIQQLAINCDTIDFVFTNKEYINIIQQPNLADFFTANSFDYCINCAAYTDVDKAEDEKEKAYAVNVLGVKNLATTCLKHNVTLIHISTDYVFDGNSTIPYKETDSTNPINYYGKTKLDGEVVIQELLKTYFIIRSSWLYGKKGKNFVKTISRLAKTQTSLQVVSDQTGCPTYTKDLAAFIIYLIQTQSTKFGVYHFSNQGQTNWFDFAEEILLLLRISMPVEKIKSKMLSATGERPKYSVMNLDKVRKQAAFEIRDWKVALRDYIDDITSHKN